MTVIASDVRLLKLIKAVINVVSLAVVFKLIRLSQFGTCIVCDCSGWS